MHSKAGSPDGEAPRMGTIDAGNGASPWGPQGLDGGPIMSPTAPPIAARAFTAANSPCLRGPCRHYFWARTHFDHGNPEGTFSAGHEPTQRHHLCKAVPGVYLELSGDSPVYECNHWHPVDARALAMREHDREAYFQQHPTHRPIPIGDDIDDLDEIEDDDDDDEDDDEEDDDGTEAGNGSTNDPE